MSIEDGRARAQEALNVLSALADESATATDGPSLRSSISVEANEARVQAVIDAERAKREARRRLDAEERGPVVLPPIDTLRSRLTRPTRTTEFRIAGWQPRNSRVVLSAPYKAGKTTFVASVVRSLADGEPFLGAYQVEPVSGTVALLDLEMGEAQLDAWLRAQCIRHDDRVLVASLRGATASFDILDDEIRASWASRLRQHSVEYVVIDCLRPILDALGLDEHRDAGRFLVALDALLLEAAISECLLVHHMGHQAERSRGDSRLRDWPDVEWRLVRQGDDPASPRYATAYGRDVDVSETRLVYDPATRSLTMGTGSRRDVAASLALDAVLEALKSSGDPLSGRAIKKMLKDSGHSQNVIDAALRLGVGTGALVVEDGPRRSKLYRPAGSVAVSGSVPAPADAVSDSVSASL